MVVVIFQLIGNSMVEAIKTPSVQPGAFGNVAWLKAGEPAFFERDIL